MEYEYRLEDVDLGKTEELKKKKDAPQEKQKKWQEEKKNAEKSQPKAGGLWAARSLLNSFTTS